MGNISEMIAEIEKGNKAASDLLRLTMALKEALIQRDWYHEQLAIGCDQERARWLRDDNERLAEILEGLVRKAE